MSESKWPRFTGFTSAPSAEWTGLGPSLRARIEPERSRVAIEVNGDESRRFYVYDGEVEALRVVLDDYLAARREK